MKQLFLYGLNGVANTAITYALFLVFINFIDYRFAIVVVYGIGICISYFLNRAIVFSSHGSFLSFAAVSVGLMLLNMMVTMLLVEDFMWPKAMAQLCAIGTVFVVGFAVNKCFVFVPHHRHT
jgi:putative flippase GtrA